MKKNLLFLFAGLSVTSLIGMDQQHKQIIPITNSNTVHSTHALSIHPTNPVTTQIPEIEIGILNCLCGIAKVALCIAPALICDTCCVCSVCCECKNPIKEDQCCRCTEELLGGRGVIGGNSGLWKPFWAKN